MSTVQAIFEDTHQTLNQHMGSTVVHEVLSPPASTIFLRCTATPWKRVVVKRRCACSILCDILQDGAMEKTWFRGFNAPTLRRVFAELAIVPSYVIDNGMSRAFSAYAALLDSGRVVTWGVGEIGGYCLESESSKLQSGVVVLASSIYAFAALKEDGSIVEWGAYSHRQGTKAAVVVLKRNALARGRICEK